MICLEDKMTASINNDDGRICLLGRVSKQQQAIDDLLCEAVSENSSKSIRLLLDFANIYLKSESISKSSIAESDLTCKWMEKRDIRALILSAQTGNPILTKLFLSRGFKILPPHQITCECEKCRSDPLGQSKLRIEIYKAICNPVWISLTSADPFLTAFCLCHELDKLKNIEDAFENEYQSLSTQCQDYCTSLLDFVSTSQEQHSLMSLQLSIIADPDVEKEKSTLRLLKLAIHYKQKKVVAHSIPQHVITSLVFDGIPRWRSSGIAYRLAYILGKSLMFPITSLSYIFFPCTEFGKTAQQPLIRFINGASSFVTFLALLALLSALPFHGIRNGTKPTALEYVIFIWLISLLVAEINQLSQVGHLRYFSSGWNWMDITMIFFMLISYCIWTVLYIIQPDLSKDNTILARSVANGLFTCGTIMSFFRLVYLCQIARFLGLLQLCLGKMIEVIFQFAFISCVVLWSFSVGMVFLYNSVKYSRVGNTTLADDNSSAVQSLVSGGFDGLPTTMVTLAWASLNMIGLDSLKNFNDRPLVYLWSAFLFTLYYGVAMIVLLNMLIAMMSNSYQQIENNIEVEHKFAKTKLLLDYICYNHFLPCPFNIIPTRATFKSFVSWLKRRKSATPRQYSCEGYPGQMQDYKVITKLLVERYLRVKHRVELSDLEKETWDANIDEADSEFEVKVKRAIEKLIEECKRSSFVKTASLEDSGLDISFSGENSIEALQPQAKNL